MSRQWKRVNVSGEGIMRFESRQWRIELFSGTWPSELTE